MEQKLLAILMNSLMSNKKRIFKKAIHEAYIAKANGYKLSDVEKLFFGYITKRMNGDENVE